MLNDWRDGFCRYRPESLRDSLRADVVGRDQRDKPLDGSTLVCPFPDGRGCFLHDFESP